MKFIKILLLPIIAMTLMITSCQQEPEVDIVTTTPVEPTEVIEDNPILARSNGQSEDGVDFACFVVLYPFSFVDVQGTEYPVEDEAALIALENQEVECVDFKYPLNVDVDGEDAVIESAEELGELFAGCLPDGGWNEGFFPAYLISFDNSCYEFVYPMSLQNFEGETLVINDESEFNTAIATEPYNFVFPLSLINEEDEVKTVARIEGLFETLFDCNEFYEGGDTLIWNYEQGFEYIGCYMVEFPMGIVLEDGTTVTVNNHEELCEYMFTGELVDYAYPLTLIDEEGVATVVNSEEELDELLDECWGDPFESSDLLWLFVGSSSEDGSGDEPCFDITFPLEVIDLEGEVIELNTQLELENTFISGFGLSVVYPVTVTMREDGTEVVLNEFDELFQLVLTCE